MEQSRMENGKSIFPPPRESFIIASKILNIRRYLDGLQEGPFSYRADRAKPGDDEAVSLIRTLTNWGVTSEEYFTAMPRLLEYAEKKEGGFDADLLTVTQYLMRKVLSRRGGIKVLYSDTATRTAYLSDVYGQVQAIKDFIWNFPELKEHKRKMIEFAKKDLEE